MNIYFLKILIWISTIGTVAATFLPHLFSSYWLIDLFSHFKVQYAVVAFLTILLSLFFLKGKVMAIALLALSIIWNGSYILPLYLSQETTDIPQENAFTIASINLLSNNTSFEQVKGYINRKNPEILVLMEFNPQWKRRLKPILSGYPSKKLVPRNDNFGMALLSKIQMNSSVEYFTSVHKPSIACQVEINGEPVSIVATHPVPPVSQAAFENRNKQLAAIAEQRGNYSKNLVVLGDLNTSSFSPWFKKIACGGLRDSRLGFGLLPTWPIDFGLLQTTLDHCLVSKKLTVLKREAGKNIGSDHLPIFIEIGVETSQQ